MSTVMKPKLSHIHKNTGQLGQLASDLGSHPCGATVTLNRLENASQVPAVCMASSG